MSPFRIAVRWALTLIALGLLVLALLIGGLKLVVGQADRLREHLSAQLASQLSAIMDIETLDTRLHGLDPSLTLGDMTLVSRAGTEPYPLLELEQAYFRLDTRASLLAGYPVLDDARIANATLHLYQDQAGGWRWPPPVDIPEALFPETEFDLSRLDFIVEALPSQQLLVENLRLVLHGIEGSATLLAPQILLTGDGRQAHLEGQLFLEGQQRRAMELVMEFLPGKAGWSDYNAAMQARVDLRSLAQLGRLLTGQEAVKLSDLSGEVNAWGQWRNGRLDDARALLEVPELALVSQGDSARIHDLGARAQWLRGENDTWQAWIGALEASDDRQQPLPLPEHLQIEGDNSQWLARSTPFDIAPLATWGERLPLPDTWQRLLNNLKPRGRVAGLEFGLQQHGWQARAALEDIEVDPWGEIPGGGPMDAWVEMNGGAGRTVFSSMRGMKLSFPQIFAAPLSLDHASGVVDWVWDGQAFSVSGEALKVGWRDALVDGDFRYADPGVAPNELDLRLDMRDIDAIETPLLDWLPVKVLDNELLDWLEEGIAGHVPYGKLRLHQRFDGHENSDSNQLQLELRIEQGRLPYDPEWPVLEQVSGLLKIDGEDLSATVEHAEAKGLISEGAEVALKNDWLSIEGSVEGASQGLLDFLAASPIEGLETFSVWQSEGHVAGKMRLGTSLGDDQAFEMNVEASVDVPHLMISQADLGLGNVNGELHYHQRQEQIALTGTLGARAFDGPLLARFDVGGQGISLEGRALARGLLDWANLTSLNGLMSGYFPYTAKLNLDTQEPRLVVDSDLNSMAIHLPPPFGKRSGERVPLHIESRLADQQLHVELDNRFRLRWRSLGPEPEQSQGQLWLEGWPDEVDWPSEKGWHVSWRTPHLDVMRWQEAGKRLELLSASDSGAASSGGELSWPELQHVRLETDCLYVEPRCLGTLEAGVRPLSEGWEFDLAGSFLQGKVNYRPHHARPLDMTFSRLNLDAFIPESPAEASLAEEVAIAPEPEPLPTKLSELPAGQLAIDTLHYRGHQFGPLTGRWASSPQRLRLAPLTLEMGEITANGELVWEASGPYASLTRSRIGLSGGDLGTMLEVLGQPLALQSKSTQVQTQLAWPGAPWQFALERSRGSIEAELKDGRFLTLESPSARLVGLLNVDNLLRRLRLDFSDVTGKGTAFDSVAGAATLYGGHLETRGPIEIDGPSTQFNLDGNVDLVNRQLDTRLAVTVPVSQNLPLAAVLAGAPYVGGALFLVDKLFGGWVDKVTRIHYRVRGSWASPQITLENAE